MRNSWHLRILVAALLAAWGVVDAGATISDRTAERPGAFAAPDPSQPQARRAILWENNGCTGENRSVDSDHTSLRGIFHDEARSMTITGPVGTAVSVYDAGGFGQDDDYALIIKDVPGDVCVRTFETGSPRTWVEESGYRIWYAHGGNLDGKVSSIRFDSW